MSYLLAIETSGKFGSVALQPTSDSNQPARILDLPTTSGSAQTLTAGIAQLLRDCHVSMTEIECLGLVSGPGSFTGLRVGVATAKSLGYALKIPIVELDTLDVIYHQWQQANKATDSFEMVHALLDAYRGQLFAKSWSNGHPIWETKTIDLQAFLEAASTTRSDASQHRIVGPGCDRLAKFLDREVEDPHLKHWGQNLVLSGDSRWEPHARGVADLALKKWRLRQTVDPFALLPHYFRGSAAEEKANKV
jgi:tRNA threonylcarbamoyladenosine biosynthesis protein TsaB